MNAQRLLIEYLNNSDDNNATHAEALSKAIRQLVRKALTKYAVTDLEDFEDECVVSVWCKIASLQSTDSSISAIDNIEAFIRQTVHNKYCDAIRRKRPKWYNIKLELMETFSGKTNVSGFAMWQNPKTGNRMCGYDEWCGRASSANVRCRALIEDQERFRAQYLSHRTPQELPIYELVAAILDYCGGPVEIDTLTSCIAELIQARNEEPLSIDTLPDPDSDLSAPIDWLISHDIPVEEKVTEAEWFEQVMNWFWKEFLQLSVKQRKAILLGMTSEQVMTIASVVGLAQVADALEMDLENLAELIPGLPLPDSVIATQLGISNRAVPSVRFKAWGRIRRRTRKAGISDEE
ncbi:MAG: hypothetical protein ACUVRS_01025 [Armatimonadota bacterium]